MKSGRANKYRGLELLRPEENELLFQLIGNRCQCLAAGVIELYLTEPPKHNEWIKKHTGIITFIRDSEKRSFFLRLYCIPRKAMLWEQEVYHSMDYKAPYNYFHTFEAEEGMAAFNFAKKDDAIFLRTLVLEKLDAKAKRRNQRHLEMEKENQSNVTLPQKNESINSPSLRLIPNASNHFSNGVSSLVKVYRSMSNAPTNKFQKKKRDHEPIKKLTTDDISLPFDFRHLDHVETDTDNCKVVGPELKALFDKVGIQEKDLKQKDTRDFIYDFIERHGGMNAVKKEIVSSTPAINVQQQQVPRLEPPTAVPARIIPVSTNVLSNNSHRRKARPSEPPPAPPNARRLQRARLPKPPPPPVAACSSVVAPPPPPPPMPQESPSKAIINNAPPPPPLPSFDSQEDEGNNDNCANDNKQTPDARCMLMESIRSGISLKKVNNKETKSPSPKDTRSNLLEEIRTGVKLKKVTSEPQPNTPTRNFNQAEAGLAVALTRALAERSRAMYSESENSSDVSDNDDEWDD